MFSYFDFLFREELTKNSSARAFGMTESHYTQRGVRSDEIDQSHINQYESDDVNTAIVHTRQDIVLLVVILQRTNILLRWIRLLLICLLILFIYNLKIIKF